MHLHSDLQTPVAAGTVFQGFALCVRPNEISSVDRPIVRQYLDGLEVVSLLIEVKFEPNFEAPRA